MIDPALVDARGTMPIAALSAASADDADSALVAAQRSTLPATIQHAVHVAPRHKRLEAVRRLMNTTPKPRAALVFVDDARRAGLVSEKLRGLDVEATSLSGNDRKGARASLMQNLRDGSAARVVVTTELAARGLDFPMLTHVVNLDLPTDGSHYARSRCVHPCVLACTPRHTPDTCRFPLHPHFRCTAPAGVDAQARQASSSPSAHQTRRSSCVNSRANSHSRSRSWKCAAARSR